MAGLARQRALAEQQAVAMSGRAVVEGVEGGLYAITKKGSSEEWHFYAVVPGVKVSKRKRVASVTTRKRTAVAELLATLQNLYDRGLL